MPGSYELFLILPKPQADLSGPLLSKIERGENLRVLDIGEIGEFLLSLGPHVRFGAPTPIGDQYVYEDEQGCAIEIIAATTHVAIGFGYEYSDEALKHALRVANGIALALVAKFGLTLYDPQRRKLIRAQRERVDRMPEGL